MSFITFYWCTDKPASLPSLQATATPPAPMPPMPPVAESNTSSAGPVRAPRASDFLTKGEMMYLFVVPGAPRALVVCRLDHC